MWHLFYVVTVAAILLALFRLDIAISGRIVVFGYMFVVITVGAAIVVARRRPRGLAHGAAIGVITTLLRNRRLRALTTPAVGDGRGGS